MTGSAATATRKPAMTKRQKVFEASLAEFTKEHKGGSPTSYLVGWNKGLPEKEHVKLPITENKRTRSKLTETIVKSIRRDAEKHSMSQVEIANKYELPTGTISGVVNYKTWRNI